MPRWEPDAVGRLQQAALALFAERGYADVTVADIADRAGLTKRTFFNHFADKREVLFAGSKDFDASMIGHLTAAEPSLDPIEAAVLALTRSGLELATYSQYAAARRDLIASSTELQERNLIKTAALAASIAGCLRARQVPGRTAALAAQAAVSVFMTAFDDWVDNPSADLNTLMQQTLADLRQAVS